MAFTVNDVRDLIRVLAEHPEWRAELRPLILSEELLRLPETVERSASIQADMSANLLRLGERVDQLGARMDQLTERVDQLGVRMDQLTERVDQLGIRMDQLTERVDQLGARMDQLTERVDQLGAGMGELVQEFRGFAAATEDRFAAVYRRFGQVDGKLAEIRFEQRAPSYFGIWLQRPRVVELDEVGVDDALDSGAITPEEYDALANLDLLVRGGDKSETGRPSTVLAVEISNTIDYDDVIRAAERAAILERAGVRARGAVGGGALTGRADQIAKERGVYVRLVASTN